MTLLTCDADRRIDIHVQYITKCTPHYFLHVSHPYYFGSSYSVIIRVSVHVVLKRTVVGD